MIDDRTSAAAPPVPLRPFGNDVGKRSCVTCQGRRVKIPPGSTHLGLCDVNFPDHRANPCDTTTMTITENGGFHSVPWNRTASMTPKAVQFHSRISPSCFHDHPLHSTRLRTPQCVKSQTLASPKINMNHSFLSHSKPSANAPISSSELGQ